MAVRLTPSSAFVVMISRHPGLRGRKIGTVTSALSANVCGPGTTYGQPSMSYRPPGTLPAGVWWKEHWDENASYCESACLIAFDRVSFAHTLARRRFD